MFVSSYRALFLALLSCFCIFTGNVFAEQTLVFSVGEWEPFVGETMENYGPTAEIVAAACKKAGYKAEFEFLPWKRAYKKVKTGKSIATFPWTRTDERAIEVLFPKTPIMVGKEKAYYLKEKFPKGLKVSNLEDLKSYKMVGILGYWYEEPAKKAGINMHMVSSADLAWKVLGKGRAEILIENEVVAKVKMEKMSGDSASKFASTNDTFRTSDMFCLFSRVYPGAIEIMKKLDHALKEMEDSGEIERVLMK